MKIPAGVIFAVGALPGTAQAQDQTNSRTENGQASATVVQPLRAAAIDDLSFGTFALVQGQGGQITISETGAEPTYSNSLSPACSAGSGCTPHPASFSVSGEGNRSYGVSLPSQLAISGQLTGSQLLIDGFSVSSRTDPTRPMSGVLDDNGQDRFSVGGSLQVPATSRPDRYHSELTVTVFYY